MVFTGFLGINLLLIPATSHMTIDNAIVKTLTKVLHFCQIYSYNYNYFRLIRNIISHNIKILACFAERRAESLCCKKPATALQHFRGGF